MNLPGPAHAPSVITAKRLHPSAPAPRSLDTSILQDIAQGIATGLVLDDGPDETEPAGVVARHLVLATEAYDAWVMVWGPRAVVAAHDHEGSVGVLHVVVGELVETDAAFGFEPGDPVFPHRLAAGDTSHTGPFGSHGLINPTGAITVTVNVYSPPLEGPAE